MVLLERKRRQQYEKRSERKTAVVKELMGGRENKVTEDNSVDKLLAWYAKGSATFVGGDYAVVVRYQAEAG
jgi:predicted ATP-binding protein involved in virulence